MFLYIDSYVLQEDKIPLGGLRCNDIVWRVFLVWGFWGFFGSTLSGSLERNIALPANFTLNSLSPFQLQHNFQLLSNTLSVFSLLP